MTVFKPGDIVRLKPDVVVDWLPYWTDCGLPIPTAGVFVVDDGMYCVVRFPDCKHDWYIDNAALELATSAGRAEAGA